MLKDYACNTHDYSTFLVGLTSQMTDIINGDFN